MTNYGRQNLPERVRRLRAHIRTRRGRRDFIALGTLVDILAYLKGNRRTSATLRSMDAMLKELYNADAWLEDWQKSLSQPLFAFMKKDELCPKDRVYVLPVVGLTDYLSGRIDNVVEDTVRAICPDCEQLIGISPNGKDPKETNKRARLDVHKKPPEGLPYDGSICPGSGKDV